MNIAGHNDTNSFKSPKKAGHPYKTNAQEDRIMQKRSVGNQFNTAARIACQFSAEQGKDGMFKSESLSSAERIKRLCSSLLKSMLCGERRTGPKFTLNKCDPLCKKQANV